MGHKDHCFEIRSSISLRAFSAVLGSSFFFSFLLQVDKSTGVPRTVQYKCSTGKANGMHPHVEMHLGRYYEVRTFLQRMEVESRCSWSASSTSHQNSEEQTSVHHFLLPDVSVHLTKIKRHSWTSVFQTSTLLKGNVTTSSK